MPACRSRAAGYCFASSCFTSSARLWPATLAGEPPCSIATTIRFRAWKNACHSTESSFVRNATCQTAAPGRLTVGTPASAARRLYSASSHLRNSGSTNPSRRTTSSGNWHIHQPL